MAGCMAMARAPTAMAGVSTARPWRPLVCTTTWPFRIAPAALSIVATLSSMSSGTVSSSTSQARATAVGLRMGTSGSSASAR